MAITQNNKTRGAFAFYLIYCHNEHGPPSQNITEGIWESAIGLSMSNLHPWPETFIDKL